MDLKGFLKENNGFPENRRVHISPCFRENGEEVLWELRAVSEEEYRRAAEGKRDKWAVLCMLSVVVPDLTDKALRESYGADSGEAALQEMLYPGEYMRLLEAVKDINGFQSRRRERRRSRRLPPAVEKCKSLFTIASTVFSNLFKPRLFYLNIFPVY